MTGTVLTLTSAVSAQSKLVLQRLRHLCIQALEKSLPQPDSSARGVWNEEIIRTLTAVFELQRVELHSEVDLQRLDITLIARVIEVLASTSYFPDFRSPILPHLMEPHLRLLAAALRLYKYNGRSLVHELHTAVYKNITRLSEGFRRYRSNRDPSVRVDDWNVDFLLKHCQYLLLSIESSESLTHKIAKRAVISFDTAMAGVAHNYQNIRPALMEIIKRKRSRARWHDEYTHLEDACWMVLAGDVRARTDDSHAGVAALLEEASIATDLLRDSIEFHVTKQQRQSGPVKRLVRRTINRAAEVLQEAGPAEEHEEYLRYGILDLVYQLSFRIRKRSRQECFGQFLKIVRIVLEGSPASMDLLQVKATDVWNRIWELGEKDHEVYGSDEDRAAIRNWTEDHNAKIENYEYSILYHSFNWSSADRFRRSKRIQSQNRKLREEVKALFKKASGTNQSWTK